MIKWIKLYSHEAKLLHPLLPCNWTTAQMIKMIRMYTHEAEIIYRFIRSRIPNPTLVVVISSSRKWVGFGSFSENSGQVEGMTEISSLPVHSSPGLKVIGFSIAAPSTHSICLYSSSPKSTKALAFLSHGFHTTALKSSKETKNKK